MTSMTDDASSPLLRPGTDPSPVEIVEPTTRPDLLLVCEHAGRAIPGALDDLGLGPEDLERHIAYDIGAERVARHMARTLGCTLILQRYSRLVIDCNRPPRSPMAIPEVSDGVLVPANRDLGLLDRDRRIEEIFRPFAQACTSRVAARDLQAAFSIHSFTPVLGGVARPWDAGFAFRAPTSRGAKIRRWFAERHPDLTIGENEPYWIRDAADWFVPHCVERRGIVHSLVEIRNDHLRDEAGCAAWADRLAELVGVASTL